MLEYKYSKLSDSEIFLVTVSGTLGLDIREEIHLKTLDELNKSNYHNMLIDISSSELSKNYTLLNSLDLSSFLNKLEKKKHMKIAFYNTYEEKDQKAFEQLSQLLAKKQIKLFTNYDEAISWLRDDKNTIKNNHE